jgi:hypothetical protein
MHIGEILMSGDVAFSPWFPREADNAIFTLQIIATFGESVALTVEVFSKNSEDTGPGSEVGNAITWETVDSNAAFKAAQFLVNGSFSGFDELVRFKFSVSTGSDQLPVAAGFAQLDASDMMWVRYRMLMPTWFDTAVVT